MIRALTFHTVTCDVCGDKEDEEIILFDTPEIAADTARRSGWLVTADHRVICPTTDRPHRAALDALLPPPPDAEATGQLTFDTDPST